MHKNSLLLLIIIIKIIKRKKHGTKSATLAHLICLLSIEESFRSKRILMEVDEPRSSQLAIRIYSMDTD